MLYGQHSPHPPASSERLPSLPWLRLVHPTSVVVNTVVVGTVVYDLVLSGMAVTIISFVFVSGIAIAYTIPTLAWTQGDHRNMSEARTIDAVLNPGFMPGRFPPSVEEARVALVESGLAAVAASPGMPVVAPAAGALRLPAAAADCC